MTDTIYALSSGAPPAAIGVIRVSGPAAAEVLRALAGRVPEPRRATLAWLCDPATGERLDRALALWFPGPGSATGEDLAEFHVHGGRAVTTAVLAAIGRVAGTRAAAPGEFTRRAFEHGVIDLAEAEGLADLLAAETETQRRSALALAGGALSRKVAAWRDELLTISAMIEAQLDFADEEDVPADLSSARTRIVALRDALRDALAWPSAERLRDGVRVVIAGPPNAGKSTLLNALAGRDAAIVSPIAGTTRDLIEVPVALDGVPMLLIDSAGLRASDDPVEAAGVARADAAIAAADIILWLGDVTEAPSERALTLYPRCDLPERREAPGGAMSISAVSGVGMRAFRDCLIDRANMLLPSEGEVALNTRQRTALRRSYDALQNDSTDAVLLAEAVRLARSAFDSVVGGSGTEDMLDLLFGRFCIGK